MSPVPRRPLSDEERAAKVNALVERLDTAVAELTDGDQWTAMLRASAKFSSYSFRNMMLLWKQADERGMALTAVAGFTVWKGLERSVRKGERGLAILAPLTRRAEESTADRPEPGSGRALYGVRVVHVFDLSQTDGKPLPDAPQPAALIGADVPGLWDALARLVRAEGYTLGRAAFDDPELTGRTSHTDRTVSIRHDIDDLHASAVLAHELGHIRADHEHRLVSRDQKETEAESIAYVVMGAHGVDSGSSAVPYVTGWSGGDVEVIAAAAETVHRVAAGILADLGVTTVAGRGAAPTSPARAAAAHASTERGRPRQPPQASR